MTPDEFRTAESLHREMAGCVADLKIAPSLISGTVRRLRWRQRRRRAVLITGPVAVACAGLAGVLTTTGGHQPRPVTPAVRLTASYVLTRTTHSLSAGAGTSIAEVQGSGPGSLRWIQWTDEATGRSTIEWFGRDGKLANEATRTPSGRRFEVTYLNFAQKAWVRYTYSQPAEPTVPAGGHEFSSLPSDRAGFLAAISSGRAVIAGYGRTGGTDTVELRVSGSGPRRLTLVWISRATYLPVRIAITSADPRWTVTERISWLQRTAGNLRRFTVSIPRGFTEVRHPLPGDSGGAEG